MWALVDAKGSDHTKDPWFQDFRWTTVLATTASSPGGFPNSSELVRKFFMNPPTVHEILAA
jgi:hypothetical protein